MSEKLKDPSQEDMELLKTLLNSFLLTIFDRLQILRCLEKLILSNHKSSFKLLVTIFNQTNCFNITMSCLKSNLKAQILEFIISSVKVKLQHFMDFRFLKDLIAGVKIEEGEMSAIHRLNIKSFTANQILNQLREIVRKKIPMRILERFDLVVNHLEWFVEFLEKIISIINIYGTEMYTLSFNDFWNLLAKFNGEDPQIIQDINQFKCFYKGRNIVYC